jgi:hypothetical protein
VTKRTVVNACKYAVALGLLTYVVYTNWRPKDAEGKTEPGLAEVWSRYVVDREPIPHPWYFALAIVFSTGSMLLTFYRWYLLVRAVDLPFTLANAFRLGLVGSFFNTMMPGSVGGDILKATFLAREQERRTVAVATVIMDRVIGLWAFLWFVTLIGGLCWVAGALQGEYEERVGQYLLSAAGLAGGSTLAWLMLGLLPQRRAERFAGRLSGIPKLGGSLAEAWRAVWMYRSRQRAILGALLLTQVSTLGLVLSFYLSSRTLAGGPGDEIPSLARHCVIVPFGLVIQAIPISVGGAGTGEWGFGTLYHKLGNSRSSGVLASLVQRVITWLLGLIGYLVYLRMRPSFQPEPNNPSPGALAPAEA